MWVSGSLLCCWTSEEPFPLHYRHLLDLNTQHVILENNMELKFSDDMDFDVNSKGELVPANFSDCCERLSAGTSPDHAHIVDLLTYYPDDEYVKYDLKIQD